MKHLILLIQFFATCTFAQSEFCTSKGVYGFSFGTKPPLFGSKKISETDAVIRYQVTPKKPDARFDDYWVTVDRKKRKIYRIVAIRYLKPVPTLATGDFPIEKREENIKQGREYIQSVINQFDENSRRQLTVEDDTWTTYLDEKLKLVISLDNYWTISFTCLNIEQENEMVKQAWK
jgi:hypothetical protein